jgi:hypothetical protein
LSHLCHVKTLATSDRGWSIVIAQTKFLLNPAPLK